MPKVITSPSLQWSGSVTLADPLTLPQVQEIERVIASNINGDTEKERILSTPNGDRVFTSVVDERMLPAILACVENWNLSNFPQTVALETFPMSPRNKSHELISWLFSEIHKVYRGEIEIPNG